MDALLEGVIDMHIHAAPDIFPRKFDDLELAHMAQQAGYRGLLLKSHHVPTMDRAYHVRKQMPGFSCYGGLVLNEYIGGLNVAAVEVALELGAKQIWFPTLSAANHRRHHRQGSNGLTIADSTRRLVPAVEKILRLIAKADTILGTGHLSEQEIVLLVKHALAVGVRKILVTHPEWPPTRMSLRVQADLAESRCVYFERCLIVTLPGGGGVTFDEIAQAIREVGWETTVVATDLGQLQNPSPIEGMRTYLSQLEQHGFSFDQIRHMTATNPARLLGLMKTHSAKNSAGN